MHTPFPPLALAFHRAIEREVAGGFVTEEVVTGSHCARGKFTNRLKGIAIRTNLDKIRSPFERQRNAVRVAADKLEMMVADDLWPIPTYREMLFIR